MRSAVGATLGVFLCGILLAASLLGTTHQPSSTGFPPALFSELTWRPIGPLRASRTKAASGVPSQPFTFYLGGVNGGVWTTDDAGRITGARIALGACSAVAQRLPGLEAALLGVERAEAAQIPQPHHLEAITPIDDIRASAAYRRDAALVLLRDLLEARA